MLKVQPAWAHVNSAEPASSQGDAAWPASGTQPSGLSHSALKRTRIVSFEPSPASCARTPSCEALQMFTFAQEGVSSSSSAASAGTAVTARSAAPSATNLDLRGIERQPSVKLRSRRAAQLPDQAHGFGRPGGIPALNALHASLGEQGALSHHRHPLRLASLARLRRAAAWTSSRHSSSTTPRIT